MVSTSKILTVSYGTFSCTLEGFDDSFETMKAIAEYFRDLAADDRYFGAEPPTPDADMLARIAEREIARRVEAHEEHGKIHLRAKDAEGALAATGLLAPEAEKPAAEPPAEKAKEPTEEPFADELEHEEAAEALEEVQAESVETAEDLAETKELEAEEVPAEETSELAEDEDTVPDEETIEITEEIQISINEELTLAEDATEQQAVEAEEDALPEVADDAVDVEEETPSLEAYDFDPDIAAFMADAAAEEAELAAVADETYAAEEPEVAEVEETEMPDEAIDQDSPVAEPAAQDEQTDPDEAPLAAKADTDDIAEKLQRIRAVAAQTESEFSEQEFSEDEHAEDFLEDPSADLDALLATTMDDEERELDATPQLDRAVETLEQAFTDDDDEEVEAQSQETQEIEKEELLENSKAEESVEDTPDVLEKDELAQLLADATPESFVDTEVDTQDAVEVFEPELTSFEPDEETPDASHKEVPGSAAEPEPLVLGREDRVEIVEEEILSDDESIVEETLQDFLDAEQGQSTLSPEDEADLLRELAEVEAELGAASEASEQITDDAAESVEDPEVEAAFAEAERIAETALDMANEEDALSRENQLEEAGAPEPVAEPEAMIDEAQELEPENAKEKPRGLQRLLGLGKSETGEDVERIFDEADSQMEDKEASLRRSAIQHLRAAVAATRAERKAGGTIEKDVDDAPYRSDLAEVVRPRRPSASENPSRRPTRFEQMSAAPLKLVAEQRVDVDREPIRPRRVSAEEDVQTSEVQSESLGGFAAFAEEMGATELPEILEAAAAYMSDVEGRAEFSRPMLMNKLKEVASENYSREDGLRSFGELLRGGKLQKIRGGRFAVTEETEFRSEARNAG